MQPPVSDPIKRDYSPLTVGSALVVIFGLLIMLLRIAQQNYLMAIGVVWVANGLTFVLHVLYWRRYGLSDGLKVAVVFQGLITIAPLLAGQFGVALIFLMLGGELRFW
ncbi:hypothetical protein HKK52_01050 [Pseudomonas sp. ADAK2]|uniref:hypothetical protein n=1 Tax=unclassified Pseudomonas TaxID=196821 RepID=UPI001462D091|nr:MULTISPECIES: hypothetical protein [unclassified Pseudomonas]QJI39562.1 hypothetical protein HKK53_01050 [Pseudomonas sp. ADAK7]QJI45868.1 hypothetical protein HKK52_01050 [Pseudomonas sp. ADAK2]